MRQSAFLVVIAGVLAAPAFAQNPIANLAGSWTATSQQSDGALVTVRLDLIQNGRAFAGREQIIAPDVVVTLRVVGTISANAGGIRQTVVEELRGMRNYDLQAADIEVTGPNSLTLHMRASAQYRGDEVLEFNRTGRNSSGEARYPSPASAPPAPKRAFLTGPWTATLNKPTGPVTIRLNLDQNGENIAGRELILRSDRGVAIGLTGEVTSNNTAILHETAIEQLRGPNTYCLQSGQLSVIGTNTVAIKWQPTPDCRVASTLTLTRGTGNTQTAQRSQGITPGDAFLMMLFGGMIGGDSTPPNNSGDEENQRQLDNAQRNCEAGSSHDCYRANMPTPSPDPPNN